METNLDQKRRELFELHKAKLGADAPLMRKPIVTPVLERRVAEPKKAKGPMSKRDKIKYGIIAITSVVVLVELVFLAKEAGWLG
ncbi:hypothetical protein [Dyadobacter sp. CY326]|uniref:hypothetical protein n=1 Tax=Dyadobacter sp. CY326 TaxID=2907300 RepID=UPI001F3D69D5|nr:hypothetical protein [Dyadobacter sp. CY326]MCE7064949.1 hypothetical protein [Dyadobacter sp. CY326]